MPRYRFTHPYPLIFSHLSHGVNAIVHRFSADAHESAEGSTVVLEPGDEVTTEHDETHAHLVEIDAPKTKPEPKPKPADPAKDGE